MRNLAIILVCMLIIHYAQADDALPLIVPGSELKATQNENLSAKFDGSIWVRGTLYVRRGFALSDPEYVFIPDHASAARLPHFQGYPITWISFNNGPQALELAVGTVRAAAFIHSETLELNVTGEFRLEQYEAGVDCDSPWAKAVVTEVKIPHHQQAALTPPPMC